jgi:hypothetical protein
MFVKQILTLDCVSSEHLVYLIEIAQDRCQNLGVNVSTRKLLAVVPMGFE